MDVRELGKRRIHIHPPRVSLCRDGRSAAPTSSQGDFLPPQAPFNHCVLTQTDGLGRRFALILLLIRPKVGHKRRRDGGSRGARR